jgi:fructose-1,6-bisphosphatase/inositol monophosphatase family enzyme
MALCADGGFAAVVAPTAMFWDVAAGVALVRAAGGTTVALDGSEPVPGSGSVIVGAPRTVDAIISALGSLPAR